MSSFMLLHLYTPHGEAVEAVGHLSLGMAPPQPHGLDLGVELYPQHLCTSSAAATVAPSHCGGCFWTPPRLLQEVAAKVEFRSIMDTENTVNKIFHIVAFECMFTNKTFTLEKGLIVPMENVATIADCASVIEGVSRSRNALLNGDTKNYDWDSGYTCHQLGSGAIVVQLAQPYMIGSIRLLLWDCDDRSYSYYVEVSTNQQQWTMVADRTKVSCKSWQSVTFERQPASFIRIVGTHNTANEVFHCVHFECPEQQSGQKEENSDEPGTGDSSSASQHLDPHALQAASGNPLPPSPGSNSRSSNQQHQ
nr:BTB/POZ domain-containing protein 9 [Camelus dromedarius]